MLDPGSGPPADGRYGGYNYSGQAPPGPGGYPYVQGYAQYFAPPPCYQGAPQSTFPITGVQPPYGTYRQPQGVPPPHPAQRKKLPDDKGSANVQVKELPKEQVKDLTKEPAKEPNKGQGQDADLDKTQLKIDIKSAVEQLVDFPLEERKIILIKMTQMNTVERQRLQHSISQQKATVAALKAEMSTLVKQQTEIMRQGSAAKDGTSRLERIKKSLAMLDTVETPLFKKHDPQAASVPHQVANQEKVYYEYYDSGNHWCRQCACSFGNVNRLLLHNHTKSHMTAIVTHKKPWKDEEKQTKRKVGVSRSRQMKGVELMFPVQGFYCSLCPEFSGDILDATEHLKSDSHNDHYMEFVKKNPLYEKTLLLEKTGVRPKN